MSRRSAMASYRLPPDELGPCAVRILHWLFRYPFQRAEDISVGIHRWHKQASIYRALSLLEAKGLVEVVRSGATQGRRLYHVSPAGFVWCLEHTSHSAGEQALTRPSFQTQKELLIRLLPRLPVLLTLQDCVNGLATGAADALTMQGRRADLVRWDWERDFTHPFFAGEHPVRLQVDGAVALCLRFGQEAAFPQEIWYTLFLFHCPLLDDVRLMRQRLERLLRWRESAERWPVYSQMPPVLILATSLRQAEWWQRATEQAVTGLRVDFPRGAVACWPTARETRGSESPWLLPWRALGTNEACHIQQLLLPFPSSVVRTADSRRTSVDEKREPVADAQEEKGKRRIRRTYGLAAACSDSAQPRAEKQNKADLRLASLHFTPRQWDILYLCQAHPLLSQENLAGLFGMQASSIQILLRALQKADYLVGEESVTGLRWRLTEAGLRFVAASAQCSVRHLGFFPDFPGAELQQRGVRGRLREIRHTAGVYGFFADLASALRGVPDADLLWWETGWICQRRFVYKERPYSLQPDALAAYRIGQQTRRFWLEWDRGTMNGRDLQVKFASYGAYLATHEWARGDTVSPVLLCVVPDVAQERVLARVAQAKLVSRPETFLYTTTTGLLAREGMLAPIWKQMRFQHEEEGRCAVFTERGGKKAPASS
jgi:DNA-binding MarR family transcriptional regulator